MSLLAEAKRIRRDVMRARSIRQLMEECQKVSGPDRFDLTADSVVACTPVKDAAYWLPDYLDHHRKLGVAGFAICDTGSQDDTIAFLAQQDDVILLETALTMNFENAIRGMLAQVFAGGSWALFADIDEMFEYSGWERVPISTLAAHLGRLGFSGLPAVMVDMFPNKPLSAYDDAAYPLVRADYQFYEWNSVWDRDYFDPDIGFFRLLEKNIAGSPELKTYWGGVRERVFGERPCLTKTPLVKVTKGIKPGAHPHCSSGPVRLADFYAVLRHYKFVNKVFERDRATVAGKLFTHGSDVARLKAFEKHGDVQMHSPSARLYGDIDQFLGQEGFPQPDHLAKLLLAPINC